MFPVGWVAAGLLVSYVLTALWGRELSTADGVTPWFPPPGIALAAVAVVGPRLIPVVFVAELISAVVVFDVDFSAAELLVNTAVITFSYTVGALVLRGPAPFNPALRRLRDVLSLLAFGVVLGPLLAALFGSLVRVWADGLAWEDYVESARTWFVGDALGTVTVGPALLLILRRRRILPPRDRAAERITQLVALAGVPVATLLLDGTGDPELAYLSLLPLLWVALRYGIPGAVGAVAIQNIAMTIVAGTDLGTTPALVDLQGLMTVIACTGLVVGSVISEHQRAQRNLAHRARHDDVTGLPNRASFLEALDRTLPTDGHRPAVFLVDIDRFALVNEIDGHPVGDRILSLVGHRLSKALAAGDLCARYGGDEFVLLVRDCPDRRTGEALAGQLLEAVNGRYAVGAHEVRLSASVGAAMAEKGDQAGDVMRAAALALSAAKARDRGAAVVADLDLIEPYRLRHRLEADLPRAIETDDFHLLYQPIASLSRSGDDVRRFEALLRWDHPLHGSVPATLTVDLAEEARVIARIDRWVLAAACGQLARWRAAGFGACVSVNVSPSGLLGQGFADAVLETLAVHFLDPASLAIEVTEHALIEDLEDATAVLNRLRGHGVSVYVDDFGTGYSSFTYLERLPLDGVKLDRSLIERLGHERRVRAMTAGVIQVAHSLDLTVVAEGVENAQQRDVLAEIGCDYVQGYLIGRPTPPEEGLGRPAPPEEGHRGDVVGG